MKILALISLLLISSSYAQASSSVGLISLSAGQTRDSDLPREKNEVIYTIVVKSNQLSLNIWENLHQGELKKTYALIDKSQVKELAPYIVKECLEPKHNYMLAGDIFHYNDYFFEGIVVGIPKDLSGRIYLCSIKRNNGLRSSKPNSDLGPFELAYRKVRGLDIRRVDEKSLLKHMWH